VADFLNKKPSATYQSILNLKGDADADNQVVNSTLRYVEDGRGNESALKLSTGAIQVDNIKIDANIISSEDSNGHITLTPNGTGDVQLNTDTLQVGEGDAAGTIQSNGDYDLVLKTGNSTTGTITMTDGADGAITITPNGTGSVVMSKVDINAGTVDATIGGTSPAVGTFTTLTSEGDAAAQFDVKNSSSHQILTVKNDGSPDEVIVNEGGLGTVDFRVETTGEDHALFIDGDSNAVHINRGETAVEFKVGNVNDNIIHTDASGITFNTDQHSSNDFTVKCTSGARIPTPAKVLYVDANDGEVGIGCDPASTFHVHGHADKGDAVIKIEQSDVDDSFINFAGTSQTNSSGSLSSSAGESAAKSGAIKVDINGTAAWIRVYASAV